MQGCFDDGEGVDLAPEAYEAEDECGGTVAIPGEKVPSDSMIEPLFYPGRDAVSNLLEPSSQIRFTHEIIPLLPGVFARIPAAVSSPFLRQEHRAHRRAQGPSCTAAVHSGT